MNEKILKKGIKKRIFSVVLALAMVASLMPLQVMAATTKPTDNCPEKGSSTTQCYLSKNGSWDTQCKWYCTTHSGMVTKYHSGEGCEYCGWTAHTHGSFATDWTQGTNGHWHACGVTGCDVTESNVSSHTADGFAYAAHTGGTATCTAAKVCETCGASYGTTDDTNHSFATTWTSDETYHWHAATCLHTGETSDPTTHDELGTYGGCSICGYGDTPPTPPAPEPESTPSEPSSSSEEDSTPSVPEVDETTFKVDIVKNDKTEVHDDITEDLHVSSEAYNLSQFKTVKGFAFGIDTAVKTEQKKNEVATVKSNKVEVYTGSAQTFGKECIEVLKTSSVDVVYTFKHKGLLFRVTIPAGTDISALLDKNGFAGPLWIGKELGTAEIIKE